MRLTKNFNTEEFQSHDGAVMPLFARRNIQELANNLQVLRDELKEPIHINSGYRSPEHNRRIGGVPNSQHTKGKAADIVVKSKTPKQLAKTIMKLIKKGKMKQGGIGLYNGFVHYDIRGNKARWDKSSWYNFF